MVIRHMRKSALSLLLCGVLAASTAFTAGAASQSELSKLKNEAKELENKISALEKDAEKQEELKEEFEKKISNTEKQIALCSQQIAGLDSEIDTKEEEIGQKNTELEANKETFKQRIRAMYMSGGNNELQVLLGADDFADYLVKAELSRSVSEHDNQLMEEIVSAISTVEEEKAAVEAKKQERTSVKKELSSQRSALKADLAAADKVIAKIDQAKDKAEDEKEQKQKAIQKVEDEIDRAAKAAKASASSGSGSGSSSIKFTGNGFGWPCPGYYGITSGYGSRWGRLHKGIDISGSGISGRPIVAAASGTVIVASYNNGGYGNYVMINHGNKNGDNYITLYGHMTNYIVSSGQSVSKGQTIGYVGNTGRSTGPHLHFEVRVNGTAKNPSQFF
ncbi:MAG: peptidoglycan DD-metalloendopeptidase family protein [Clostridiales bacterium]|nr:peptidoglycan DD-metalloendopeptidase family protein [Clostridiales bacterium]